VRQAIWSEFPAALPTHVVEGTLDNYFDTLVAQRRFNMLLLALFGVLGLTIASIGIYGVIAYAVSQRTHEIGVRMALGALPSTILKSVLGGALLYMIAGLSIGLIGAWGLAGLVRGFLFEIQPHDPTVYAGVLAVLAIAGLTAAFLQLAVRRASTLSSRFGWNEAGAGVENVNVQVDALIQTGVLRRLLPFTELTFSKSMIEAWWRSLKHHWLFLHSLDSVTTVRRLVACYVDEHNRVLPHSAFRGQTPDEMYMGTGDAMLADLTSRAAAARRATRGQSIGVVRDMPVSRRGRVTIVPTTATPRAPASGGEPGTSVAPEIAGFALSTEAGTVFLVETG
jgi:hypothetical protein